MWPQQNEFQRFFEPRPYPPFAAKIGSEQEPFTTSVAAQIFPAASQNFQ